jgi:hypothetical protein
LGSLTSDVRLVVSWVNDGSVESCFHDDICMCYE